MMHFRYLVAASLSVMLAACSTAPLRDSVPPPHPPIAHDNLHATLWMQTAAEYDATVRGVFAAAASRLEDALADPSWNALPEFERRSGFETLPPAIIVDADETLIDNSAFQARSIRDGVGFEYQRWLAWVNERRARALPGALEFARLADSLGITIYFVTNRDAPAERESTVENLRAIGFPVRADGSNVMLRGDPRSDVREKSGRRRWVGERHRVLLMLGDNLGDFVDIDRSDRTQRDAVVSRYAAWWGERWFMQPNPSYGSWERALMESCNEPLRKQPAQCKRRGLRFD